MKIHKKIQRSVHVPIIGVAVAFVIVGIYGIYSIMTKKVKRIKIHKEE